MRGNGTWQLLAYTRLQVSGHVLRGFAAEAAIDSLFLLLREIEARLDTFGTATWRGAPRLTVRRLRQRDSGAKHCDGGNGNEMSHWNYSLCWNFSMQTCANTVTTPRCPFVFARCGKIDRGICRGRPLIDPAHSTVKCNE
jgi:hypothetical protein